MTDLIATILFLWLIAFVLAGLHALVRRVYGVSLLEAIGIAAIIGRLFR